MESSMNNNKKLVFTVEFGDYNSPGPQWMWSIEGDTFNLFGDKLYTRKSDAKRGMLRAMRRVGIAYENAEDQP